MIEYLVLIVILLFFSAFFSGSETALFSLSQLERKRIQTSHPGKSVWVERVLNEPRRALITILVGNVIVNTLAAIVMAHMTLTYLGPRWLTLVTVGFTLLLVWVGEIIPKLLAVRHNESWAARTAPLLHIFSILIFPLRRTVRIITDALMKLLIPHRAMEKDGLTEDELKTLVGIGGEEGVMARNETRMIRKLLSLGDRQVREIMTPRTKIIGYDVEDSLEALINIIRENHVSYIPVYRKTMDDMIGMIATEEFMLSDRMDIQRYIRSAFFVPETKRIDELFFEFQKKKWDVAIAVDEHGGTAGLVTDEDVLEEIFGEIYDEYEKPRSMIQQVAEREFLVDGRIALHDFNEYFKTLLNSESEETLAGFLMEQLGHIPARFETFRNGQMIFTMISMQRQHIEQVKVTLT